MEFKKEFAPILRMRVVSLVKMGGLDPNLMVLQSQCQIVPNCQLIITKMCSAVVV